MSITPELVNLSLKLRHFLLACAKLASMSTTPELNCQLEFQRTYALSTLSEGILSIFISQFAEISVALDVMRELGLTFG